MRINNGLDGGITLSDNSEHTGTFTILKALGGDVVFTTVIGNISGLDGKTLSNGDFIVGYFTSITLASGSLIAYYAPKPAA